MQVSAVGRRKQPVCGWLVTIFGLLVVGISVVVVCSFVIVFVHDTERNLPMTVEWKGVGFVKNVSHEILSSNSSTTIISHSSSSANSLAEQQASVFAQVQSSLQQHPIYYLRGGSLVDKLQAIHDDKRCHGLPVFISMANVFSELYWQLIENFIYTMVKFDLVACAAMICVSDKTCMERCARSHFPCIDFQYMDNHPGLTELPHALEQIAELKLFHLPKALERGVDIMMLDLDVGFLSNPKRLLENTKPKIDVYVQKDIAYVMNRTLVGWRTWYTAPLPNIGIMYVRANKKSTRMFAEAWREYQGITAKIKHNPGKDQNKVAGAMRAGGAYGFRWAFFPAGSAVLLDMVYKYNDPRFELGGLAASSVFTGAVIPLRPASLLSTKPAASGEQEGEVGEEGGIVLGIRDRGVHHVMSASTEDVGIRPAQGEVYAVHTTCYEQATKVHGLKAANAFWNPYYYTATRKTLTKPLVFLTEEQLRHEVRALLYLGVATQRAVILPNVLGSDLLMTEVDAFLERAMWPGFRVLYQRPLAKKAPAGEVAAHAAASSVLVLEPAYYWRVARDYFSGADAQRLIPDPTALPLLRHGSAVAWKAGIGSVYSELDDKAWSLHDLELELLSERWKDVPRIVLGAMDARRFTSAEHMQRVRGQYAAHLQRWAGDSVGGYDTFEMETKYYAELPWLNEVRNVLSNVPAAGWYIQNTRLCENIFEFDRGNRSCFDKCD